MHEPSLPNRHTVKLKGHHFVEQVKLLLETPEALQTVLLTPSSPIKKDLESKYVSVNHGQAKKMFPHQTGCYIKLTTTQGIFADFYFLCIEFTIVSSDQLRWIITWVS